MYYSNRNMDTSIRSAGRFILLIEDNVDLCAALREVLTSLGYKVLVAKGSAEAHRLTTNQKFDCIVTDINLEQGSGRTVVLGLRGEPLGFNHATPILVMSGVLTKDLIYDIRTKVSGVYAKPIDIPALIEKIKQLCPLSRDERSAS